MRGPSIRVLSNMIPKIPLTLEKMKDVTETFLLLMAHKLEPQQPIEQHPSIWNFPLELLLTVFQWSFDVTTLQKDRCRLSLVCRYWRDSMEESACLWTDISGHDYRRYIKKSLFKSQGLPVDIHYVAYGPYRPHMKLTPYLNIDGASKRQTDWVGYSTYFPYLPSTGLFPKLSRLEIDGVPSNLSPPGLQLNNVLSLSLVDVANVTMEQLLDVLRDPPFLERLELGRTPEGDCPSHATLPRIHLPRLTAFHIIFLSIAASNFFLSKVHAPNCSELFISAYIYDSFNNIVERHIFKENTNHFSPVLQRVVARGLYADIDISGSSDSSARELRVRFHDKDSPDVAVDHGIFQLQIRLHTVGQIEKTIRWLARYFKPNSPKIPSRLHFSNGFEEARLMDLIGSHMTITRFAIRVRLDASSNPVFVHMAQPTPSGWPLPDLEDFTYGRLVDGKLLDEALLDMLRRRYGSSSQQSDIEKKRARPLKRIRFVFRGWKEVSMDLLDGVHKILPEVKMSLEFEPDEPMW
ncbi:hypothetical protein FS837_009272 [Tulasnella sp. UAMH 9824]|nr:hypothetical protein FS837_009272 [Tulasnella sp. UAMH 9824]